MCCLVNIRVFFDLYAYLTHWSMNYMHMEFTLYPGMGVMLRSGVIL